MNVDPRDAVIVDYARSAMGRSKNGCFRNVRADDLSVGVIKGLLARNEALGPMLPGFRSVPFNDADAVEGLLEQYLQDPSSVPEDWQTYFEQMLGARRATRGDDGHRPGRR